jgi:hypothetical protein
MKAFHADVPTLAEGKRTLTILADYDLFQFDNNIKPDYSNTGGLQVFQPDAEWLEPEDDGWVDWEDEDGRGIDDLTLEEVEALDREETT